MLSQSANEQGKEEKGQEAQKDGREPPAIDQSLWSERIKGLQVYAAGEQPKDKPLIKLNANENPFPPSPKVRSAVKRAMGKDGEGLGRYPDADARELVEAIAQYHGVKTDEVFVGNGSDDVLAHAFFAFFNDGDAVVSPAVTYGFYPVWAARCGLSYRKAALKDDLSVDPDALIDGEADGVVFANPNAQTGSLTALGDVERIARANAGKIVIVDEAYIDFAGPGAGRGAPSAPALEAASREIDAQEETAEAEAKTADRGDAGKTAEIESGKEPAGQDGQDVGERKRLTDQSPIEEKTLALPGGDGPVSGAQGAVPAKVSASTALVPVSTETSLTAAALIGRCPNLLVVRTMSKSRALAGLRIGYALGNASLIEALRRSKDSFNTFPVSVAAQAAGVASLQDEQYFSFFCAKVMENRKHLTESLEALGFKCWPSSANFVLCKHETVDSAALQEGLRKEGVLVRRFPDDELLKDKLRITVGTSEQISDLEGAMDRLIKRKRGPVKNFFSAIASFFGFGRKKRKK